jgi:hypothetical protein
MSVPTAGAPSALVHGIDAHGYLVTLLNNRGRAFKRNGKYNLAMFHRARRNWCDPSPPSIADARAEYVA